MSSNLIARSNRKTRPPSGGLCHFRTLPSDPKRLHAFNWTMAALLLLSLWPVVTLKL